MSKNNNVLLLVKYFKQGWLARKYYSNNKFYQPYSAEDRLWAGKRFYEDFLKWRQSSRLTMNYSNIRSSRNVVSDGLIMSPEAERFRKALRVLSKQYLSVIYKIVLEECEIKPSKSISVRERLYFNDEIKGLLCRGLDELCSFYILKG